MHWATTIVSPFSSTSCYSCAAVNSITLAAAFFNAATTGWARAVTVLISHAGSSAVVVHSVYSRSCSNPLLLSPSYQSCWRYLSLLLLCCSWLIFLGCSHLLNWNAAVTNSSALATFIASARASGLPLRRLATLLPSRLAICQHKSLSRLVISLLDPPGPCSWVVKLFFSSTSCVS